MTGVICCANFFTEQYLMISSYIRIVTSLKNSFTIYMIREKDYIKGTRTRSIIKYECVCMTLVKLFPTKGTVNVYMMKSLQIGVSYIFFFSFFFELYTYA